MSWHSWIRHLQHFPGTYPSRIAGCNSIHFTWTLHGLSCSLNLLVIFFFHPNAILHLLPDTYLLKLFSHQLSSFLEVSSVSTLLLTTPHSKVDLIYNFALHFYLFLLIVSCSNCCKTLYSWQLFLLSIPLPLPFSGKGCHPTTWIDWRLVMFLPFRLKLIFSATLCSVFMVFVSCNNCICISKSSDAHVSKTYS